MKKQILYIAKYPYGGIEGIFSTKEKLQKYLKKYDKENQLEIKEWILDDYIVR